MQRQHWVRVLLVVGLGALDVAPLLAGVPSEVEAALAKVGRFTPAELLSLAQGGVIARVEQPAGSDGEVFVVAAVKIKASREQTLGYYGQMIRYVDGQVTLAFGTFGSPPQLEDVAGLSLDSDEIKKLQTCRPKDCDLKLAGAGIERLRSTIDWKAPDRDARVDAFVRQAAVDYVAAYLKTGDDALIRYDDKSQPVSLKAQWQGLMAHSPHFQAYQPELKAYLEEFPRRTLPGSRDIVYWVKENYGWKPVVSIVHGVVYQPPAQPDRTLVFQKQIYASHNSSASAALATVWEARDGDTPVTYIVYSNRSRGDLIKGGLGLKKKVASDQALKAAQQTLGTIKSVLEKTGG